MKRYTFRVLILTLALLLVVSAVACSRPEDKGEGNEPQGGGQTPADVREDGIPTIDDHDPSKTYVLPDYSELNISEYITLGKYRGLTLTLDYDTVTISDEELESTIDTLLHENHPDCRRAVQWGDTVVADYVGTLNGVEFSGGTAYGRTIVLKENSGYIPGFVEGLVGAVPGEAYPVDVTFPEDYHAQDLAGKDVVFTFTVHYVDSNPELDDAFVTDYTEGNYTSAEAYRAALRQQMTDEAYEAELHTVLWETIAANAAAKKYPTDAVMYYYDYQYDMYSYYAAMYGLDFKTFCAYNGFLPENLFNACMQMVKEEMVYYAVFEAGNYTYTDEQYARALDLYTAQNYAALNEQMMAVGREDFPIEEARDYFDRTYQKQFIAQCLEESAFNDLIGSMTVIVSPSAESGS